MRAEEQRQLVHLFSTLSRLHNTTHELPPRSDSHEEEHEEDDEEQQNPNDLHSEGFVV